MTTTETVAAALGAGKYAKAVEDVCIRYGMETALEKAHFIAQVAHESDGFNTSVEYASGKAYDTGSKAKRLGNTPEGDGDGQLYKGRGLIQLTGRENYRNYSRAAYGDDRAYICPQMVADLPDAAIAAGWYWETRHCKAAAMRDDLEGVTRLINGGLNGIEERRVWLQRAKKLFGIQ